MGGQRLHHRLRRADLTAGALGDRVGGKKIFIAGFAVFTVASLACALAPTSEILIASRAAQGVGAAILVPNALALLNHAYPDAKERGRAVGLWLAGASAALTAGPPVGGALIALVGWRSIFLVNLPIGLAGLWLTWRYAADTPRTSRELDLPGQAAAIGALGTLAAALIEGGRVGWSDPRVIAAFGVVVILSALFLVQERRAEQPMLPLSLFAHPVFARTTLVGLLINIPFYGLIFVFSLYFQEINGLSPLATGMAFVPMMGLVLRVNLVAPRLAERLGAPAVIGRGRLSAAGCLALLGVERGAELLGRLPAVARAERRLGPLCAAADLGAPWQRREVALGHSSRGAQFGAPNRQRTRRRAVRVAAWEGRRVPVRPARGPRHLCAVARLRGGRDRDRRSRGVCAKRLWSPVINSSRFLKRLGFVGIFRQSFSETEIK